MTDDPELTEVDVQRVNGFAPGDRVAIVNCEMAGAYGKIEFSSVGCMPNHCRVSCNIVWVELSHIPAGVTPHNKWHAVGVGGGGTQRTPNVFRFKVNEVTHID